MTHVAIDTDTMRRHLFGGWHLLTFLAARAREGKLQIHIPWINHHETLTGIRDQVEDLTARKQLDTGLAEISKSQVDHTSIVELSKVVTQTRERLYEDAMNRYRGWIASAQAEIISLTLPQSMAAWEAYFSGNAPYRHAKSRGDLPDGFVLQALLEIASRVGKIHFIVGDVPFRQACSQCESVVCHDSIYRFCSSQNFAIDVAREKELQRRELPIPELENRTGSMLKRKLAGLVLRMPTESDGASERMKIEAIHEIEWVKLDPNSMIHLAADDYLIALDCKSVLQCKSCETNQAANYVADLKGHVLIHAPLDGNRDSVRAELDAVEAIHIVRAPSQTLITVTSPPEFKVDPWFAGEIEKITAPGKSGLVVIAGGNQTARKRVAEHLLRQKQRRDPDVGGLYLIGYPQEFSNTLVYLEAQARVPIGEDDIFDRAAATFAKGVAVSIEKHDWLASGLGFVIREDGYVIATMSRLNSVSAVVRELHSNPHGKDLALEHLLGVAMVMETAEGQIKFRATTYGEWGDGSWWGILEHDKFIAGLH